MVKSILFFLAAVIDTSILTSIVSTQLVLMDVTGFGLDVPPDVRLDATLHDLLGVGGPLLVLIGSSFLVAFVVAHFAHRRFGGKRTLWYCAAGFVSVPCALFLIRMIMGGMLLASARTTLGMFLVACCCMAGGWFFAWLGSTYGNAGVSDA